MVTTEIRTTVTINLDIETAAKWFASLDDDLMCKFLVAVAEEAKNYPGLPENQWFYLGDHLRNCECSTDAAREMVKAWAHWAENSTHA